MNCSKYCFAVSSKSESQTSWGLGREPLLLICSSRLGYSSTMKYFWSFRNSIFFTFI